VNAAYPEVLSVNVVAVELALALRLVRVLLSAVDRAT